MLSRSTTPLVVSYILLVAAGILFLETPPLGLSESTTYNSLLVIWALFYMIGASVALTTVLTRGALKVKHIASLWHFEIAGLSLIVAANLIYSYALMRTGLYYNELNVVAFSLVISAFASSFIGRVIDILKLIRAVNKVSLDRKDEK